MPRLVCGLNNFDFFDSIPCRSMPLVRTSQIAEITLSAGTNTAPLLTSIEIKTESFPFRVFRFRRAFFRRCDNQNRFPVQIGFPERPFNTFRPVAGDRAVINPQNDGPGSFGFYFPTGGHGLPPLPMASKSRRTPPRGCSINVRSGHVSENAAYASQNSLTHHFNSDSATVDAHLG